MDANKVAYVICRALQPIKGSTVNATIGLAVGATVDEGQFIVMDAMGKEYVVKVTEIEDGPEPVVIPRELK